MRLVFCLKRKPGMSLEDFQAYWFNNHAPLVKSVAGVLNIAGYVQLHSANASAVIGLAGPRETAVEQYDGVAELTWNTREDFMAAGKTEEGRAAAKMLLEDERHFIDLPNSPIFLTAERVVV